MTEGTTESAAQSARAERATDGARAPGAVPVGEAAKSAAEVLGAEFRRIRTQVLHVSQSQMAARLGIAGYSQKGREVSTSRAAISRLESGSRNPGSELLARLLVLSDAPARTADLMVHLHQRPESPATPATELGESGNGDSEDAEVELRQHLSRQWWWLVAVMLAVVVVGAVAAAVVIHRGTPESVRRLPKQTWTETTGTPAHTWSDYKQASGTAGRPLGPRQSVQVSCRVRGYVVLDGDPWWYRIESSPWDGRFYATSDAFYNQGSTSGPVDNGVIVDEQVPLC